MKKTEAELQDHISRLEAIIDNLPFEVWYKDVNGNYLIVNKKLIDYFKTSRQEMIGKNDYDLYPEPCADTYRESDQALIAGVLPEYYEYDLWNDVYEDYKRPVFDENGKIIGITGYSKNITEYKNAKNEIIESERKKTTLLSNMPGVAFRCGAGPDYPVTFLSDSCYDLTGYTSVELLSGKPAYNDLIHPEYRIALLRKWDAENDKGVISTDEYPITMKSGETKWVMEQSQRLYDADNNVIGSEGFIIDVTERKVAEKSLKRSEERFRTMFEEAPLGMAIVDAQTGDTYQINTRYAQIVGRTKSDLLSTNIKAYTYQEEIEEIKEKINLINTNQLASFSSYKRLLKPDGATAWVNLTIAPFNSEEEFGNPRLLCMIEDVTDRRSAEEEILYLSYYDQLTGLYNRRFYTEELRRLDTERNLPITLVMADVNGLKLANDAFGHLAGDRLLKYIADTFRKQCRADDIIARLGGDEFILLLPKTDPEQAEKLIARINAAISEDKSHPVVCSVSFGWDTKKDPAEDISKVYTNAEDLMYRHKLMESTVMRNDTITLVIRTLFQRYKREELHAKRVGWLSADTAKALGMNSEEIKDINLAGLMHNIGYIGLREELLKKRGSFTEPERREMERHPEIGYQLLRSVGKYSSIAEYVLYHHERVDGKGYPSRAPEWAIPVQARIIAIADAYDAMIEGSAYRGKLSEEEAVGELVKHAGSQFDKHIAEVFIKKVLGGKKDAGQDRNPY